MVERAKTVYAAQQPLLEDAPAVQPVSIIVMEELPVPGDDIISTAHEGPSVPIESYRSNASLLFMAIGKIAKGSGFIKNATVDGSAVRNRYGDDTLRMASAIASKNETLTSGVADAYLGRAALIETKKFDARTVDRALSSIPYEIKKGYFGAGKKDKRAREYRRLGRPIEYAESDLEVFAANVAKTPALASRRSLNDFRRSVESLRVAEGEDANNAD